MKELSILIPCYKENVIAQVDALLSQCHELGDGVEWEIVVADDGSPVEFSSFNNSIADREHCRLIKRKENVGRSGIRNFLAHEARYDTLLFIDAGMMPCRGFVSRYVANIGKASVVCGNITVDENAIDTSNLRCKNELRAQKRFTAAKHSVEPYKNFHSGNFMVTRSTMLQNPFREDIKTYGYEDTLFGKQLSDRNIRILHIDNPIMFVKFESNFRFIEKTQEGIETLFSHRKELIDYSPLLKLIMKLKSLHLLWLPCLMGTVLDRYMLNNLTGDNPNLRLFDVYRLCRLSAKVMHNS